MQAYGIRSPWSPPTRPPGGGCSGRALHALIVRLRLIPKAHAIEALPWRFPTLQQGIWKPDNLLGRSHSFLELALWRIKGCRSSRSGVPNDKSKNPVSSSPEELGTDAQIRIRKETTRTAG